MRAIMRLRDTDIDTFVGWFNRWPISPRLYVSEDITLILWAVETDTRGLGVTNIRVSGEFVVAGEDEPEPAPSVMDFRFTALPSGARLEADCYNIPSVMVRFLEVLTGITRDWEGRATLERLESLREALDTDRDLTIQDRRLILWAMDLETELLGQQVAEEPDQQDGEGEGEPAEPCAEVPEKETFRNLWKARWPYVKAQRKQGKNLEQVSAWFMAHEDKKICDLYASPATLRKIELAGQAGCLDE